MRRGKELCRAFDLHIAAIRLIYLTAPRPLGTPKGDRDKQRKAPAAHRLSIAFLLSAAGQALRAIKVNVIARDKWH